MKSGYKKSNDAAESRIVAENGDPVKKS